jgi:hypothetical protein
VNSRTLGSTGVSGCSCADATAASGAIGASGGIRTILGRVLDCRLEPGRPACAGCASRPDLQLVMDVPWRGGSIALEAIKGRPIRDLLEVLGIALGTYHDSHREARGSRLEANGSFGPGFARGATGPPAPSDRRRGRLAVSVVSAAPRFRPAGETSPWCGNSQPTCGFPLEARQWGMDSTPRSERPSGTPCIVAKDEGRRHARSSRDARGEGRRQH